MANDKTQDWVDWHRRYDDPQSRLSQRLLVVQRHIRDALDHHAGKIRIVSMCAGQGRDLLGVLAGHPRRDDVEALLVELDPRNVAIARRTAGDAGLERVRVLCADAALSDSYAGAVPAEIVLACGVFGNISDDDVRRTVEILPHLCAPGATVLWTRAQEPDRDIPGMIRQWFTDNGFDEVAFEAPGDATFRVGVARLTVDPRPLVRGFSMFRFPADAP